MQSGGTGRLPPTVDIILADSLFLLLAAGSEQV